MDWSKGYRASYYMARIDPVTWRDIERIEITGGSLKREPSGLRESADIKCIGQEVAVEMWMRVYMEVRQNGASDRVALFTGLASTPDSDIRGTYAETTLECYSVLKPADDILLQRGWYAQAGRSGGEIIGQLLSVTAAPVVVAENSPALSDNIIAEDGETNLTMVQRVLTAINWRIKISGDGTVNVIPQASEATAIFDPLDNDIVEPEIKVTADWYACPNVFMAVADDLTGIARDDSDGPLSVKGRGREIWAYEAGVDLSESESIGDYAMRRLKEAQTAQRAASYARRYVPGIVPGDLVILHYPAQDLTGVYRVESQSIDLGYNARTSEDVLEVVI